jgi:hypothetical protein
VDVFSPQAEGGKRSFYHLERLALVELRFGSTNGTGEDHVAFDQPVELPFGIFHPKHRACACKANYITFEQSIPASLQPCRQIAIEYLRLDHAGIQLGVEAASLAPLVLPAIQQPLDRQG